MRKRTPVRKFLVFVLAVFLLMPAFAGCVSADEASSSDSGKIVILHTNDVHCAVDQVRDDAGKVTSLGYAAVAAYKKKMQETYGAENVTLVDAGDALQGAHIGTLSKGMWLIDIMNKTGYDLAVPGNHDFDFGVDRLLELQKSASFSYLCCNMTSLPDKKEVFSPYKILTYGDKKVAYVGISTPESYTKSTPAYFQDENGNRKYSFAEDADGTALCETVQSAADAARADGADYVIAVGHLGEEGTTPAWKASAVIAKTDGIDLLIDAHSHELLEDELTNKDGKKVPRAQAGTALAAIGKITIDTKTGEITHELVTDAADQDPEVQSYISGIEKQFQDEMNTEVGKTENDLTILDPEKKERAVRNHETNLGDFCADAIRTVLHTDIAFMNGGGIRADISRGSITKGKLLDVFPWGNELCVISAAGQQIKDALEFSARNYPEENGGFLQVSGLTYTIDPSVPSSVQLNESKEFVSVSGAYRVRDIEIAGLPLDTKKTYTIGGINYTLTQGGDGYTMFKDCTLESDAVMKDYLGLEQYIEMNLHGTVGSDYADPKGQGRITIPDSSSETPGKKTYTVAGGDSLWKIAAEKYGSGSSWTKIYTANKDLIADPDLIYPGQEFILPAA